jgi:hypothetical protein
MDTRATLQLTILATATAALAAAQALHGDRSIYDRINVMSDAEQVALAKSILDRGVRVPDDSPLDILARGRSSLILPIIERKIEDVLRSPNPLECFTDKSVDIETTINIYCARIAGAGDQQALQEASKLLKLDEKRFDRMVENTMSAAIGNGHGFTLAYQGFELGDPAIDRRIMAVIEDVLEKELPNIGNPIFENVSVSPRREWAEALVERDGGAPSEAQWAADPIASRLKPALRQAFHNDVVRFSIEAAAKRTQK